MPRWVPLGYRQAGSSHRGILLVSLLALDDHLGNAYQPRDNHPTADLLAGWRSVLDDHLHDAFHPKYWHALADDAFFDAIHAGHGHTLVDHALFDIIYTRQGHGIAYARFTGRICLRPLEHRLPGSSDTCHG